MPLLRWGPLYQKNLNQGILLLQVLRHTLSRG